MGHTMTGRHCQLNKTSRFSNSYENYILCCLLQDQEVNTHMTMLLPLCEWYISPLIME